MNLLSIMRKNQEYMEDFTSRMIYHSNRIEGNRLTYSETCAILQCSRNVKITAEPREFYEVINHKNALEYLFRQLSALKEEVIIELATLLNRGVMDVYGYRRVQVYLQGVSHVPPSPYKVPFKMEEFIEKYENSSFENIFDKIAYFHIMFEKIHPFVDGNGRTGRLLMLRECLVEQVVPFVITAEAKADYFTCLASEDVEGLAKLLEKFSMEEKGRMEQYGVDVPN